MIALHTPPCNLLNITPTPHTDRSLCKRVVAYALVHQSPLLVTAFPRQPVIQTASKLWGQPANISFEEMRYHATVRLKKKIQ